MLICPGDISKYSIYLLLYPTCIIGISRVDKHVSVIIFKNSF